MGPGTRGIRPRDAGDARRGKGHGRDALPFVLFAFFCSSGGRGGREVCALPGKRAENFDELTIVARRAPARAEGDGLHVILDKAQKHGKALFEGRAGGHAERGVAFEFEAVFLPSDDGGKGVPSLAQRGEPRDARREREIGAQPFRIDRAHERHAVGGEALPDLFEDAKFLFVCHDLLPQRKIRVSHLG